MKINLIIYSNTIKTFFVNLGVNIQIEKILILYVLCYCTFVGKIINKFIILIFIITWF